MHMLYPCMRSHTRLRTYSRRQALRSCIRIDVLSIPNAMNLLHKCVHEFSLRLSLRGLLRLEQLEVSQGRAVALLANFKDVANRDQ